MFNYTFWEFLYEKSEEDDKRLMETFECQGFFPYQIGIYLEIWETKFLGFPTGLVEDM